MSPFNWNTVSTSFQKNGHAVLVGNFVYSGGSICLKKGNECFVFKDDYQNEMCSLQLEWTERDLWWSGSSTSLFLLAESQLVQGMCVWGILQFGINHSTDGTKIAIPLWILHRCTLQLCTWDLYCSSWCYRCKWSSVVHHGVKMGWRSWCMLLHQTNWSSAMSKHPVLIFGSH